jgi:hypothetical protein
MDLYISNEMSIKKKNHSYPEEAYYLVLWKKNPIYSDNCLFSIVYFLSFNIGTILVICVLYYSPLG